MLPVDFVSKLNMKVNYPILLITDVHTNLHNLRRVLNKHPNHTVICLGDITNLWDKATTPANIETINYFIKRKLACLKGNHDEHVGGNPTTYQLDDAACKYLENLPITITVETTDGKKYKLYHYRPNDFWSLETSDKMTFDKFCSFYGSDADADAVVIGHLHSAYEIKFPNHKRQLIGIGALRDGEYAILNERGIKHHKL